MASLVGAIATILFLCNYVSTVHVGLPFGVRRDDEMDKSRVPMIRIPHDIARISRRSFESNVDDDADERAMYIKTTPVSLLDTADLRNLDERLGRAHEEKNTAGHSRAVEKENKPKNNDKQGSKGTESEPTSSKYQQKKQDKNIERKASNMIAFDDSSQKKNAGSCMIDSKRVENYESIYENDCGTLQCRDGAVTWKLKTLAKDVSHCQGIKSIPSMYAAYSNIVLEDDDPNRGVLGDVRSLPKKSIASKHQADRPSKKWRDILEPKYWD